MKKLNELLAIVLTLAVVGFIVVWVFMPSEKQAMLDWWHGSTVDCPSLREEIITDRQCQRDDDCKLARKEQIRAEHQVKQYESYCGPLD
jgi:hypothetical protein